MTSSHFALVVTVLFFVAMLIVSLRSRHRDRMQHGKKILDRFNPEHSKKPLGL